MPPSATPATGLIDAGPVALAPIRPSWLMVMPLRAAEQDVLVVLGEADLHTAGQLRTRLIEMLRVEPPSVLVELGALEFCDLHGLSALRDAARAAHGAGVTMSFRGMSPQLSLLDHSFPALSLPPRAALTRSGPRMTPAASPSGAQAAAARADAPHRAEAGHGIGPSREYRTGHGGRRRAAPDGFVHAVPTHDTTRSAVCGARVWMTDGPWTGDAPGRCPECALAVVPAPDANARTAPAPRAVAAPALAAATRYGRHHGPPDGRPGAMRATHRTYHRMTTCTSRDPAHTGSAKHPGQPAVPIQGTS